MTNNKNNNTNKKDFPLINDPNFKRTSSHRTYQLMNFVNYQPILKMDSFF